jgi:hypothetical protein
VSPRHALLGLFVAVGAVGCNQDPSADNGKGIDEPAPCPECLPPRNLAYPAPPYGVAAGAIINPFPFQGYINAQAQSATLDTISLSDFYNPHGDDAFPAGSPYGDGAKKPTALLIDIASVWCGPCNEEARSLLNGLYAKYKPCGGEFLFQLAEGAAPGAPVDATLLHVWVSNYHVAYPATIDPAKQLLPLYNSESFPDGAIVDTRTMKIVEVISGVPDDAFWSSYESLLDASCLAGH